MFATQYVWECLSISVKRFHTSIFKRGTCLEKRSWVQSPEVKNKLCKVFILTAFIIKYINISELATNCQFFYGNLIKSKVDDVVVYISCINKLVRASPIPAENQKNQLKINVKTAFWSELFKMGAQRRNPSVEACIKACGQGSPHCRGSKDSSKQCLLCSSTLLQLIREHSRESAAGVSRTRPRPEHFSQHGGARLKIGPGLRFGQWSQMAECNPPVLVGAGLPGRDGRRSSIRGPAADQQLHRGWLTDRDAVTGVKA